MQFFIQHVLLVTMGDKLLINLRSGNPLKQLRGLLVDALAPPPPPPPLHLSDFQIGFKPPCEQSFLFK